MSSETSKNIGLSTLSIEISSGALGELKPKIKEAAKRKKELASERIAQIRSSSSSSNDE